MKKVNFTEMKNGTKEDYMFLDKLEKEYVGETADRILGFLSRMTSTLEGYKISRLEHSLQSATRAYKNKESEKLLKKNKSLIASEIVDRVISELN